MKDRKFIFKNFRGYQFLNSNERITYSIEFKNNTEFQTQY